MFILRKILEVRNYLMGEDVRISHPLLVVITWS